MHPVCIPVVLLVACTVYYSMQFAADKYSKKRGRVTLRAKKVKQAKESASCYSHIFYNSLLEIVSPMF